MIVITLHRFQANERWYGVDFQVPGFAQRCRAYGQTREQAESRALEILDSEIGKMCYRIEFADKAFTVEP